MVVTNPNYQRKEAMKIVGGQGGEVDNSFAGELHVTI